ncbi:uncharacterized protein LOC116248005 isoform X2 [Nymphaea colorata]|uniref:uncharacterized protein LOC116248005 isoform X2 n=1 Tax=Nymphaea colorata TaxID=210225 RepID=UPI00214E8637|nr:uncharacterized protein LOC116248005 isoform X2 [Nymphaea colorata]
MKNSVKSSYRQLPGRPSLVQEMAGRPSPFAKEGGEPKKKLIRLRSVKIADRGGIRLPTKQGKGGTNQSGVHVGPHKKNSSARKVKRRSPNYMNPTSNSDRRKEESLQVSTHKQTSDKIQSSIHLSHARKKNDMKSLSRVSSLKPRKPSMKTCGVPSYLVPDVTRATCSSTLKDSKFPDYVDLNPGGTESEGTSVMKVCPYTYCSLNGHCHKPSPPLKRFLSARRRSLKAQKSIKMREAIGCKIKTVMKGRNKTDTGLDLMPQDVLNSPRSLDSWDEQSCELLTEDWDDDFFIEIYANSIPDITDPEIFEEFGVMEHSSLDVPQVTNEKMDTTVPIDPSVVAYEKVHSAFGKRAVTEVQEDHLGEPESVVDSSFSEPSLVDVEEDGNQQDQSTDSFFAHEEAINASGGTSEPIDCSREEENPASVENSSSIQTAAAKSKFPDDDLVSNNECDLTSSASEIIFMAEAGGTSEPIDCSREEENPASAENSSSIQTAVASEICAKSKFPDDDLVSNNEYDLTSSASEIIFMAEAGATSEQIDFSREEENLVSAENSSSIQTALASEICAKSKFPEDDLVSNNECDLTSSASEITLMAEAIPSDEDIVSYGPEEPVGSSDEIAFPPVEDNNAFSESLNIGTVAAPSDGTCITKGDDGVIMEFLDINTTGVECIDNNGEIPKSDNGLPGEATPVASSNKIHESDETNDMEENLGEVDVADDQAGLDLQTLDEENTDGSGDDLVADHGMVACASKPDSAFREVTEEDQKKMNEPGDTPEDQVYDSVLVFKAKETAVTEVDNLSNAEKDTNLHQSDSAKGKNGYCQNVLDVGTFPVEQESSTTDGENCNQETDELQISQDENMYSPPVSWNRSYISSEERAGEKEKQACTVKGSFEKGATKQIKHALHQDAEELLLGAKTKHYAKDENEFIIEKIGCPILCRGSSLKEITNFEGKEQIEDVSKGGKFMMPERVLRLTRSFSAPKQIRRGRSKYVIEDRNEGRMFNPRRPMFLPINPDPEREKVNLRHQMMDERKKAEEWMLDYALRKAVSRLAPSQRKKVTLLVAAFEAIMPSSKCEARRNPAAVSSTYTRSLQACH